MGILSTLSIAAQALKAQQLAIQTTGHNLANSATPGYSRQRVDLVSAIPTFQGGVFVGQGVDVQAITRVVDRFAEAELLSQNGDVGYSEAESQALNSLQEVFPVTGGINGALSDFFTALSDLTNNPAGMTERIAAVAKANALGDSIALTRQNLTSLQQNIDQDLQNSLARLNVVLPQIAELNKQIALGEASGDSANDFRDKRQVLLQEVTKLTGATAREDETGQVTVAVDGLLLVGGDRFASFQSNNFNAAGFHQVTYVSPDGNAFDATTLITEGKIGATVNARDHQVQNVIDGLDQFAKALVDTINTQHALGFDLNGAAGGDFFAPIATTAGAAADVKVADPVAADPRLIAAAASADALPGDNRNALALVGLRSANVAALGGQTLENGFLSLIGTVGSQVESAQARFDFQQDLLSQTQARRESTSGVNIDEEMIKLIQFQRAFEASSLLVRTGDSMYQSLLEMVK
jgi:flagellar hook-associated protein 1 FlgK